MTLAQDVTSESHARRLFPCYKAPDFLNQPHLSEQGKVLCRGQLASRLRFFSTAHSLQHPHPYPSRPAQRPPSLPSAIILIAPITTTYFPSYHIPSVTSLVGQFPRSFALFPNLLRQASRPCVRPFLSGSCISGFAPDILLSLRAGQLRIEPRATSHGAGDHGLTSTADMENSFSRFRGRGPSGGKDRAFDMEHGNSQRQPDR